MDFINPELGWIEMGSFLKLSLVRVDHIASLLFFGYQNGLCKSPFM
jgi:hypothetical protein